MELNQIEIANIEDTTRQITSEAIKELAELQLMLVGGGCEVSFN